MPEGARLSPQLPLELALDRDATLDNLCSLPALDGLLAYGRQPRAALEPLSYVHGGVASGKSHLLQALCHAHEGSVYLPLAQLDGFPPASIVQDLEQASLVAIDDLQHVAGRGGWEEALFHLINRARAAASPLFFGASAPPVEIGICLPDLRSRLSGGITWATMPYGDEEKRAILAFRAQRRGLALSNAVLDYLYARDSRALPDLLARLDELDRASLQLQRPITVPLVRETMGW